MKKSNVFDIRYGKAFKAPRIIAKYFLSSIYPLVVKIWPLPKVLSIEETLVQIVERRLSIARFGDSEFLYIIDKLNLPYQKYDERLAKKLIEILAYKDEFILVGLPSGYHGLETQTFENVVFWRSQISWIYPRLKKYLNLNKTYSNASMSRLYIELKDKSNSGVFFQLAKRIWDNRNLVIIEGEKSRLGIGNDLFSNVESIKRILGPAHNAFSQFEELLKEGKRIDKDSLILIAMGPTAKPLAFEFAKLGLQAIDIGNIDVEYEWFIRNSDKKIKIPGKYTSEAAGGRIVEDIQDEVYNSQIIAKFI